MLSRRGLITGLISLAVAPAIVRASSLMPVKVMVPFNPEYSLRKIVEYWAGEKYTYIYFEDGSIKTKFIEPCEIIRTDIEWANKYSLKI